MSQNLTFPACPCNVCSGKIEFDPSRAGETIQCPHCNMETILFIAAGVPALVPAGQGSIQQKEPEPEVRQQQPTNSTIIQISTGGNQQLFARRQKGKKTSLGGICCEILGFVLLFVFPIGTIFGVILMVVGAGAARIWRCSHCGNRIEDKHVQICPHCKAQLLS